jgi:hypothetical protein
MSRRGDLFPDVAGASPPRVAHADRLPGDQASGCGGSDRSGGRGKQFNASGARGAGGARGRVGLGVAAFALRPGMAGFSRPASATGFSRWMASARSLFLLTFLAAAQSCSTAACGGGGAGQDTGGEWLLTHQLKLVANAGRLKPAEEAGRQASWKPWASRPMCGGRLAEAIDRANMKGAAFPPVKVRRE